MPTISLRMAAKEKCWVWFRNALDSPGSWNGGWFGTPSDLGGVKIEHYDYVPCRVPEWRVIWKEPEDFAAPPEIPDDAEWKLFPVDLK